MNLVEYILFILRFTRIKYCYGYFPVTSNCLYLSFGQHCYKWVYWIFNIENFNNMKILTYIKTNIFTGFKWLLELKNNKKYIFKYYDE